MTDDRNNLCYRPTILVAEDDAGLAVLVQRVLKREGYTSVHAGTGAEAMRHLEELGDPLILLDYQLPDMTAADLIRRIKESKRSVDFVVMTGNGDERVAVEMMRQGARDYLVKDDALLDLLPHTIRRILKEINAERTLSATRAEARDRERYHRSLLHQLQEDLLVVDRDYRVTDVNQASLQTLELTREEVIGQRCYEVEHGRTAPCDDPEQPCLIQDVFQDGCARQTLRQHPGPNGTSAWMDIRVSPLRNEDGEVVRVIKTMRDITELKQLTEDLRASEGRYRNYIDNAPDGVFVTDLSFRIVEANQAACELSGYSETEIIGLDVRDFMVPETPTTPEFHRSMIVQTGRSSAEMIAHRRDGEEIYVSVASTMLDEDRFLSFVKDISARRRAEVEKERMEVHLRQQQKLESLGTMAAGVAHEINNPISVVLSAAALILDDAPSESETAEHAQLILEAGQRTARIVRNMLSFSRQDNESHSPARPNRIVDNTLSLVSKMMQRDQIAVEVDLATDLPTIKCRSHQIQQVLMNFLTNARDALNERYPEAHEDKRILIRGEELTRSGEQWVRVTVEDHGTGIPEDVQPRVFDPFFTTKSRDQGTGLGLAVSHGIVREHRGDLRLETDGRSFTRFHLDLRTDNGWSLEPKATVQIL